MSDADPDAAQLPDPFVEQMEWRMRLMRELAEIGMHMTRELCVDVAIQNRVETETLRDVFGDKLTSEALVAAANAPKKKHPGAEFDRLSRAVRLTLNLYGHTAEALRAYRLGVVIEEAQHAERKAQARRDEADAALAAEEARREAHVARIREVVLEAADREIPDIDEAAELELALDERLESDPVYWRDKTLPFEATVRRLCADLDLAPDWSQWTGEGWAQPDPVFRGKGSFFDTPSRKPSANYAAFHAALVAPRRLE